MTTNQPIVAATEEEISRYVALSLAAGLKLYAKTGIKPNRSWTPTKMLQQAGIIMNKTYRARDYMVASNELRERFR